MKKVNLFLILFLLCAAGCTNQTSVVPSPRIEQIEFQTMKTNNRIVAEIPITDAEKYAPEGKIEDTMLNLCFIGADDNEAFFFTKVLYQDAPAIPIIHCLNIETNRISEIELQDEGYIQSGYYISEKRQILIVSSEKYMDLNSQSITCYQMPTGEKLWELEVDGAICLPLLKLGDGYVISVASRTQRTKSEILWLSTEGNILKSVTQDDAMRVQLLYADENQLLFSHLTIQDYQVKQKIVEMSWSGKLLSSRPIENIGEPSILLGESGGGNYFLVGKGLLDDTTNMFADGFSVYFAGPGGSYYEVASLALPEVNGYSIRFINAQKLGDYYYLIGTYNSIEEEMLISSPYSAQQFVIAFDERYCTIGGWIYDITGWKWSMGLTAGSGGQPRIIVSEKSIDGAQFVLYNYSLYESGAGVDN